MGDYKEEKRALAEAAPPPRIDLGVFNNSEQSTSLVTNQTLDDEDRPPPYPGVTPARTATPVQTPFFKFKKKYLTVTNALIAGGVLMAIFGLILLYNVLSGDGRQYLTFERTSLGYFKHYNQKISFDESNNLILLSRQRGRQLEVERFSLDEKSRGFLHEKKEIPAPHMENCVQLADDVMCCDRTSPFSGVHCYLTQNNEVIESSAKFYHNFSSNWQSLEGGKKLLPVKNRHDFVILNLKDNLPMRIDRSLVPKDHKAVGYFFSMDTYEELAELVKIEDKEFRICDYVPDTDNNYLLKNEECRDTHFTIEPDHFRVKFCDNPLYSAVLQYGNAEYNVGHQMDWVLQVKFEKSTEPYYVVGEDIAPLEQVAINCREDTIDIYIPGRHELYQYSVILPADLYD